MVFSFAEVLFNIEEIFFFFFCNDVDTYCRGVLALTLSSFIIVSKIYLVDLVFFINLVGRKFVTVSFYLHIVLSFFVT